MQPAHFARPLRACSPGALAPHATTIRHGTLHYNVAPQRARIRSDRRFAGRRSEIITISWVRGTRMTAPAGRPTLATGSRCSGLPTLTAGPGRHDRAGRAATPTNRELIHLRTTKLGRSARRTVFRWRKEAFLRLHPIPLPITTTGVTGDIVAELRGSGRTPLRRATVAGTVTPVQRPLLGSRF